MDKRKIDHVLVLHENWFASLVKDFGSLGSLALLIAVNHAHGAGSWIIDGVGGLMLLAFLISRSSKLRTNVYSRAELAVFVHAQDPAPGVTWGTRSPGGAP